MPSSMSQMTRPNRSRLIRLIASALVASTCFGNVHASNAPLLRLRVGDIDPQQLQRSSVDLQRERSAAYLLVQFDPAKLTSVRAALRGLGAKIEAYVPDAAYRVRRVGVSADALRAIDGVLWVGTWTSEWKVEPLLRELVRATSVDRARVVELFGFVDGDADALLALLLKQFPQARVVHRSTGARLPRIAFELTGDAEAALDALAQSDLISWISIYAPPQSTNTESAGVIQGGTIQARSIWARGLTGNGQIVAVADTGLDANESWFTRYNPGTGLQVFVTAAQLTTPPAVGVIHANAKVIGNWVQPGAWAYETLEPCGTVASLQHGTHVAGSITGDSGATATPTLANADVGDGMAPNAQLLMQDIGADCLRIADFPAILKQARAAGARLHNNSWGASNGGEYSGFDFDADDTTWLLEDLLMVASAGNRADNFNAISSPGAAKNVLTVGALEHGEDTTPAVFTSVGHSNGKPMKPDVSAPGVAIVSADGDDQSTGPEEPGETRPLNGTSMSTPTVAGGAALLRQYFEEGFYPRGARRSADRWRPLGATMKAVLMNGTLELINSFVGITSLPSLSTGWGRIFLERDLYFPGDVRRHRIFERTHGAGIDQGETQSYVIDQVGAGESLRVTLAWFDAAGVPGVEYPLVNDLDLRVTGPNGETYLGNAFGDSQGRAFHFLESLDGFGAADRKHSVEAVRLLVPAAGAYTIEVIAHSVPGNDRVGSERQGYALVVSGALSLPGAAASAPANLQVVANDGDGISVDFDDVAGADSYQLYRADGECKSVDRADFHLAGIDVQSRVIDTHTIGGDRYAYRVRAVVDDVEGDASACIDVVSNDSCELAPIADGLAPSIDAANAYCAVVLNWNEAVARCAASTAVTYRVERSTSPDFSSLVTIASGLPTSTYTDDTVLPDTIYFYRTIAVDSFGNETPPGAIVNATPVGEGGPAALGFFDDADTHGFAQLQLPWQFASGVVAGGTYAYKTGAEGADYPPATCAALTLPALSIPQGASLVYDAHFDFETQWDGVVVELSIDGGATWKDLAPDDGYPSSFALTQDPPVNSCEFPNSRAAFSGSNASFETFTSSLAGYAGEQAQIRWRLSSDPGIEHAGFHLDNIRISAPGDNLPADLLLRSGFESDDAASVGRSCIVAP